MNRLFVTLAHPQHAGMLRALRILADAAPQHGWELRYGVPSWHDLITSTGIPREHVTVIPGLGRWRRWRERLRLPVTLARLTRAARGASALYSTTLSTFPHCWYAGRVLGVPQVVHVYSSYGSARPYRKHLLGRARHVVAPSADSLGLADHAVGGFAPDVRARVAYNGMDVERIAREAAAPLPIDLGPPALRVGMVGNLDWRKNPRCLIEAAPAIRAAIPDVRVYLIGAFPDAAAERTARARIAELGLEDTFRLTGFLANPFPVVRALDVLVHPALRDPFPLALLEAMALARPIVASRVGGIPEMLVDGESGWLVPPDDPAALATGTIALLRDAAARTRMGGAAFARLTGAFSLDGFARTMFQAFDDAVRDGRAETGRRDAR
jgi:glycosyltransferase involved in cell wall biosynthesis